jgi:hypothetical protein
MCSLAQRGENVSPQVSFQALTQPFVHLHGCDCGLSVVDAIKRVLHSSCLDVTGASCGVVFISFTGGAARIVQCRVNLQKRLFADDSQNDFEVQGPIQAISTVGVQSVASGSASTLNEPAGKRPKVEDLTALLLGLQQSMHDQSLGIVSAIRTATEAGQACVLIAERMQQGFASLAAAPAAAVVAPSTPSVAVINQSPSPASPSPPRGKLPEEFEKYCQISGCLRKASFEICSK